MFRIMMVVAIMVLSVTNLYSDDKIKNIRVKKAKEQNEKEAEKIKEDYFEKLKKLKKECREKLSKANDKYKKVLKREIKTTVRKGDLEGALALKKELEGLQDYKDEIAEKDLEKKKFYHKVWKGVYRSKDTYYKFDENGMGYTNGRQNFTWILDETSKTITVKWSNGGSERIVIINNSNMKFILNNGTSFDLKISTKK